MLGRRPCSSRSPEMSFAISWLFAQPHSHPALRLAGKHGSRPTSAQAPIHPALVRDSVRRIRRRLRRMGTSLRTPLLVTPAHA